MASITNRKMSTSALQPLKNDFLNEAFRSIGSSSENSNCDNISNSSDVKGGAVNMSIGHNIKWEHLLDFEKWCDDMEEEMRRHKGFRGFVRYYFIHIYVHIHYVSWNCIISL